MTGRPGCVNSRNPHSKVCDFVEKVYMEFLTQTTFLPLEKSLTKFTDTYMRETAQQWNIHLKLTQVSIKIITIDKEAL